MRVIGSPLGQLAFSMGGGMISSEARSIEIGGTLRNMIQTDAPINPGNSGGPLFNQSGELIGIVAAKYTTYSNELLEGLGFAIPIDDVKELLEDIVAKAATRSRAYLGVTPETLDASQAQRAALTDGIYLLNIDDEGPAAKAGLLPGDVITSVDGIRVKSTEELAEALSFYAGGDTVNVGYFRNRGVHTVKVTLGSES